MSEKVTSGQSLNFGGKVANILHSMEADRAETQIAIEKDDHPVWDKITGILKELLVKAEKVKESILEWIADMTIPAQPEFVVAKNFTTENPDVKFWGFSGNFQSWFMPMTEKKVGEATIAINKLRVQAKLADMTPEQPAPRIVTISQIYWMISQQPKGEKPNGKNRRLLVNGYADLFRVIDVNGEERAVSVYWRGGFGWIVDAYELELRCEWGAGYLVVFRK